MGAAAHMEGKGTAMWRNRGRGLDTIPLKYCGSMRRGPGDRRTVSEELLRWRVPGIWAGHGSGAPAHLALGSRNDLGPPRQHLVLAVSVAKEAVEDRKQLSGGRSDVCDTSRAATRHRNSVGARQFAGDATPRDVGYPRHGTSHGAPQVH